MDRDEYRKLIDSLADCADVPMPLADLRDCVISRDIAECDQQTADIFIRLVDTWKKCGLTDQEATNLFFKFVFSLISENESENIVDEVQEYLRSLEDDDV